MKIERNTYTNKNTFGSIPLYRATIAKKPMLKAAEPLKAIVSVFEKSDLDKEALTDRVWRGTHYGIGIIQDMEDLPGYSRYMPKQHFLLVETPTEKANKQIKAMAAYHFEKDMLVLGALQSKNQTEYRQKTKGAGSLILYALSKIAEQQGKEKIFVDAYRKAINFYRKLGLDQVGERTFVLTKENFAKFQRALEERYKIISATERNINI